jgi:hypothetical protein
LMAEIAIAIISFIAGLTSHLGACTQPAVDYKGPPADGRSLEIAVPIKLGVNPPACPPGG